MDQQKMEYLMEMESNIMKIKINIQGSLFKEWNQGMVNINMRMGLFMLGTLKREKLMGLEKCNGQMEIGIKGSFKAVSWMVMGDTIQKRMIVIMRVLT